MKISKNSGLQITTCDIQAPGCTATETPEPVLIVHTLPNEKQYNVCQNCLNHQIKSGTWQVTTDGESYS
jgi:hypothetical protein